MRRRLTPLAIFLTLSAFAAAQAPATPSSPPQSLIVHEWGTFTSVAGADGRAVEWLPLSGPADLPCFVDRLRFNIKGSLPSKIRMETPVLYFYTPHAMTVSVNVRFRQGIVTEWFPRAAVTPTSADSATLHRSDSSSSIAWRDVKISPGADSDFPIDSSGSHYYLARQTDASPLQSGSQHERFLFYRGVGGFDAPIVATAAVDGRVVVKNPSGEPVGDVIVFKNAGGMIAYEHRRGAGDELTLDAPAGDGEIPPPHAELEQILTKHGLYPKEARAMVNTWRDSWFEEGTRLFYIVSRKTIDAILPLDINPIPSEVIRVFVGRIELMTPRTPTRFRQAVATRD
jgi:hypothetical protein